jgi:hypothetical protein
VHSLLVHLVVVHVRSARSRPLPESRLLLSSRRPSSSLRPRSDISTSHWPHVEASVIGTLLIAPPSPSFYTIYAKKHPKWNSFTNRVIACYVEKEPAQIRDEKSTKVSVSLFVRHVKTRRGPEPSPDEIVVLRIHSAKKRGLCFYKRGYRAKNNRNGSIYPDLFVFSDL